MKSVLIGIAANLLLDVLKSTTVINGVVQEKLMFARCKGGVGMLSESMNSYKDAVNDEYQRKNKSTGKTTKSVRRERRLSICLHFQEKLENQL